MKLQEVLDAQVESNEYSRKFLKAEEAKVTTEKGDNVQESAGRESEKQVIKHQEKQLTKHFGNMSIHFESYNTKCFIEITKLELKDLRRKF